MAAPPADTRIKTAEELGWSEAWSKYNNEHTWTVTDELFAAAQAVGKHPAQVAINWLLQRPGVTAPIIGARTLDQLETNLGASGWALNTEQLARLDRASQLELPYPYNFIANGQRA
jgi:aryl-alcohol dehydrogenase-like predicted oxidoreductase